MRIRPALTTLGAWVALLAVSLAQEPGLPPLQTVQIGSQREFRVNGKPFFPLMAWLQDSSNFDAVKACEMNTTAGYWSGSSGTQDVTGYMQLIQQAGLYGVLPFEPRLKDHPQLLGYIHDDEPDLPQQVSDAEVLPAEHLVLNRSTPLWKIVDGVTHTWSVLDPLADASVTIALQKPVTAVSLAVWPTVSGKLPVAKDVVFSADGQEILRATLQAVKGQQKFDLPQPVTFQRLTLKVDSVHPGDVAYGSIGEVEAFDAGGRNVLLSPPRYEPRARPPATLEQYQQIRAADPQRPVFLTLTGNFHPHFGKWTDQQREQLYPAYIQAADVVGYDIYPIYGWNRPDWLYLVHEATDLLTSQAGPRPVYAWIETSRGGQWTGPLEKQHEVTPAHIRAEVWMAICRGATAIGYFTHVWKPSYEQFGVPADNRRALREINQQITRLTQPILSPPPTHPATVQAEGAARVDVMTRSCDGQLYLFAVRYDAGPDTVRVQFTVPGLPSDAAVRVVDEDRQLTSGRDGFADSFQPLDVHIYQLPLAR